MRENGWIEGTNLLVEYRFAKTQDRLPALALELIALAPDLVVGGGPQQAIALRSATAAIPIVFGPCSTPWRSGSYKACRIRVVT